MKHDTRSAARTGQTAERRFVGHSWLPVGSRGASVVPRIGAVHLLRFARPLQTGVASVGRISPALQERAVEVGRIEAFG